MSNHPDPPEAPTEPPTAEELILAMSAEEIEELLLSIGLEPTPKLAQGIQSLVRDLGSLEFALEALQAVAFKRSAA
ncbi:MAG: hypothetical protein AAGJ40_02425 [Planctomycetota bacterium]